MVRKILAVFAGVLAAGLAITVVQFVGHTIYPPPADLSPQDTEGMKAYMATLPAGAFLLVLLSYVLGSFVGGLLATLVSGRQTVVPALLVGVLLMLLGFVNLATLPHPVWFSVLSTLVYVPCAWLAFRLSRRGQDGAAAA